MMAYRVQSAERARHCCLRSGFGSPSVLRFTSLFGWSSTNLSGREHRELHDCALLDNACCRTVIAMSAVEIQTPRLKIEYDPTPQWVPAPAHPASVPAPPPEARADLRRFA